MSKIKFYALAAAIFLLSIAGISAQLKFYIPETEMNAYSSKYGDMAVRRAEGLLTLMDSIIDEKEDVKVIKVNSFYNQIPYKSDMKTWGKSDYWASRLEFLGVGQGDCEDYAVSKFLTLLQLGVPEEKLFLTYVKAKGYADEAHMVVTYYKKKGTVPFVLDNYIKKIMPATQRKDLFPVYSFTANDLFLQKQKGLGKRVDPSQSKNVSKLKSVDLEIMKR
ncbi:MAG: transglutaminase [Denitrovibrio sp.]|nr:MAG: transglutaminase [Denitrovibrio sp.]